MNLRPWMNGLSFYYSSSATIRTAWKSGKEGWVKEKLHWFYADAASGMHDKRMRGMNRWRKTERVRGWIIAGESAPFKQYPRVFEWGRNVCSRIVYLLWDIRCRESVSFNWMPIFRVVRGEWEVYLFACSIISHRSGRRISLLSTKKVDVQLWRVCG